MTAARKDKGEKVLASNRQAFHSYFVGDRFEAGIVLLGTEVKSLRAGRANLKDAFARVQGREIYLLNCHIPPYSHGSDANHEPLRTRKLLMHRREIERLGQQMATGGQTLVPLRLYLSRGKVKVELALAKGKKLWDKRQATREREEKREARAAVRGHRE